jgi:hypothetical protein
MWVAAMVSGRFFNGAASKEGRFESAHGGCKAPLLEKSRGCGAAGRINRILTPICNQKPAFRALRFHVTQSAV